MPADTVEGLRELFRFRDFDHFIEVWILTTNCLRAEEDFRQVVVDYAAEAKRHGAVYLEAIFSPIERTWRGVSWDEIFTGYCDGAQEARELHGVEVKLTPDITRSAPLEDAHELVRHAARYRDRGIVAVGLGGEEAYYPNPPFGARLPRGQDGRPRLRPPRGRGGRARIGQNRPRPSGARPAAARVPRNRGSGARRRAGRTRTRPRHHADLERTDRRCSRASKSTRSRSSSPPACAAPSPPTTR